VVGTTAPIVVTGTVRPGTPDPSRGTPATAATPAGAGAAAATADTQQPQSASTGSTGSNGSNGSAPGAAAPSDGVTAAAPAAPATPATPGTMTAALDAALAQQQLTGTPAATAATAAGPTGAAPSAPGLPSQTAAAAQLVRALGPLRSAGDGTHRITLELHPAELGSVRVLVELRAGTMNVQLAGGDLARDAMRHGLPDLRQQLENLGISTGSLDVSQHAPGEGALTGQDWAAARDGRGDRLPGGTAQPPDRLPPDRHAPPEHPRSGAPRALDLNL
jgi:flagellar hook-length control protein FliK